MIHFRKHIKIETPSRREIAVDVDVRPRVFFFFFLIKYSSGTKYAEEIIRDDVYRGGKDRAVRDVGEDSESKENNAVLRQKLYVALCPRGRCGFIQHASRVFVSRLCRRYKCSI